MTGRDGTRLARRLNPGQFTSARICTDAGHVEVSLSDGGNWQIKARFPGEDDWRFLCSGDLEGRVFVPPAADEAPICFGPLRLDIPARRLEVEGSVVSLTAREFDFLAALASDPGRVFKKEELLRDIWGHPDTNSVRSLDAHAYRIRCKLREAGVEGFVINYRGVGYRLAEGCW
jgi:DNA-binding response OmpR family regulator